MSEKWDKNRRLSRADLVTRREKGARCAPMELEFHQLDRRYETLRRRSPERERRLLASLAEHGQQAPIIVVVDEGPITVRMLHLYLYME